MTPKQLDGICRAITTAYNAKFVETFADVFARLDANLDRLDTMTGNVDDMFARLVELLAEANTLINGRSTGSARPKLTLVGKVK